MGEAAEMMLDGTCCEGCGEFMDGDAPGYPRYCSGCRPAKKSKTHAPSDKFFCLSDKALVALKFWLKERPYFNNVNDLNDQRGKPVIRLVHESNPDSDWSKVKGFAGTIICSDQSMREKAAIMARKHLQKGAA